MNLLDVAIIGVFLLFAFLGLYNGFMVSLLGTASFFVSWLCGVLFSPLVANSILSHEGLTSAMLYYTEGAELVTDVALRQMPVNQLSRRAARRHSQERQPAGPHRHTCGQQHGGGGFLRTGYHHSGGLF